MPISIDLLCRLRQHNALHFLFIRVVRQHLGSPAGVGTFKHSATLKVVTGDVHNKYSRWNDKPAKEGDILADIIDLLIPLAANNKRPFLLDFSPGEQAYVDVVINALCTGLEALGALRQEYSDLPYLEMKVVDWLGSAMALPASFTHNGGTGGGYVLRSTKEAFTTAMAAAQQLKLQRIKSGTSVSKSEKHIIKRMVVYASSQLDFDSGFYPVFVQALMGASSTGSYDDISSLLRVAYRYGLWLHVDASLGGNLLICNENCDMLRDIEKVHSISVDTHAFLMNAPQATFIWTRNLAVLERGRLVAEQSLNHNPGASDLYEPRPRTPLPALKAYMAMRLNGMNSSQKRIRHVYAMTKRLREFMSKDARLEIINNDRLNVICFRVKGTDIADSNVLTYRLCAFFNKSGRILVTHWMAHGMGMIRMCINHGNANEKVIDEAWNVMKTLVDQFTGYLLRSYKCFST
ncbi:unnamed protein product [Toxocara canis]|uniref:Aromatic-L-amino-acid decarboxylase n=1 Tax=Toxocara canis TaxID=6265 RepID=A0A183V8N9_TOXCA|nr:unnamed protein product [Toxocara canis]